jgi:hypothetical protein
MNNKVLRKRSLLARVLVLFWTLLHVSVSGYADDSSVGMAAGGTKRAPTVTETTATDGLRRSDTPLSPRSRPSSTNWREPFERFHSSRILWTYDGPAIIADSRDKGISVQCAVDFWVPESHPRKEEMVCTNRHGEYGGNKSDAKQRRGVLRRPDINSNAWREYQLKRVQDLVDSGCRSFQQDNPWLNYQLVRTGGCYTDESMDQFRDYLRRTFSREQLAELGVDNIETFNYRVTNLASLRPHFLEFQKNATSRYHDWLHTEARRHVQTKHSGQSITFSGNLLPHQLRDGVSSWLFPHFNFLASEANGTRGTMVQLLQDLSKWAAKFPLPSAVTFPTNDVWLNQRAIATAYALGLVPIAPWDVYVSAQAPRYYGNPDEYASLFRMVRANPRAFDEYTSGQDGLGAVGSATLAQGYVADVRPEVGTGTIIIRIRGFEASEIRNLETLRIGGRKYKVTRASNSNELRLEPGTTAAVGEGIFIIDTPSSFLISTRKNVRDPKKNAIHVVSWSDTQARFLVLRKDDFPSPPSLAITPEAPKPRVVSPQAVGNYYIYSLEDTVWTVLY